MALETGTYINSLNAANPAATDGLSQADDHLRLIKSTIKATFPSVTGAVSLSHTEINALDTRLDGLEGTGTNAPAITYNGGAPTLKSGITATELRDLIDLGTADSPTFTNITASSTVNAATLDLGDWTITVSGTTLKFAYSGTDRFSLDSSGNLVVEGNVTGYGSA